MDRRTLLAITLCFGIYVAWQKLYLEPRMPQPAPTAALTEAASLGTANQVLEQAKPQAITPAPAPTPSRPETRLTVPAATGEATVGDSGRFLKDWRLKSYKKRLAPGAEAIDLGTVTHQDSEIELAFDDPAYAYLNTVQGTLTSIPNGTLWVHEDANVKLTREITGSASQAFLDLKISIEFKNKRPGYAFLSLAAKTLEKDPEEQDRQLLYFTNQTVERVLLKDVALTEIKTPLKYIAAANRYFVLSLVAQPSGAEPRGLLQPGTSGASRISLVYPLAGQATTIPARIYFGPKELDLLRSVDGTLDHVVDFGWFTVFAYPLLKLLKWFYQYVGNYGVAIILLTLLLKIATYPLTYKSMKSMKEMAKLQPQLQKIREKYADDKEALNREMLSLMRTHGYNPMAGCLPILIQMPIFFALYRVLYSSIELYQAPFALWINDLSAHDPYYVTPVLLTVTMFVQQKLTPNTATDPMQAKMLQFMPIMFGAFMLALPSGLTVYMLVNALASIVQQMILNKKFDTRHVAAAR